MFVQFYRDTWERGIIRPLEYLTGIQASFGPSLGYIVLFGFWRQKSFVFIPYILFFLIGAFFFSSILFCELSFLVCPYIIFLLLLFSQ